MALPAHQETTLLPPYSTSLNGIAHFLLKPELVDPVTAWPHRRWYRVTLELQGTQIFISQQQLCGQLFCCRPLSLQGAQVGLATDYRKRLFVVRVRAEGFQFLLAAATLTAAISWVDKLDAAIAVSTDLDERREPRYQTMASSRVPTAETETSDRDTRGIRSLRQMWKCRRGSEDDIWLNEQAGERGALKKPDMEQYLEIEAKIVAQSCPTSNRDRSMSRCSCSTCFNSATPEDVPLFPTPSLSKIPEADRFEPLTKIAMGFVDGDLQHADRVVLARRRLVYAQKCAKTLGFRATWLDCRYLRNQRWVKIEPTGVNRDYVLSLAGYLVG